MGRPVSDVLDRILPQTIIAAGACWLWQGFVDRDGYGRIWAKGSQKGAHRIVYERVHGKAIPDGLVIDHLCRVRHCLNPAHMETVTNEENVSRGALCRCGSCPRCRRNAYMRDWYARRQSMREAA